jgi:hypothetical protein
LSGFLEQRDKALEAPLYHVMLEGRRVGPYDRRTIVGMRIKKTLSSEHELVTAQGVRLTVADLLNAAPRDNNFQPNRSGSYSVVQARYSAALVSAGGPGPAIPKFKGEVEARVQGDVLRIAGRFRQGLGWREDRVKLPLDKVVHARVRGTLVDLWLRHEGQDRFQRITLELFSPESAGEFVDFLPQATPWPAGRDDSEGFLGGALANPMVLAALAGTVVVIGVVLVLVFARRH